ncbi:uncharacterized protein AB675_10178 [Cyphellophora attinorum]|uniref:Transcription elongation factor Eaf N-terminal domain-containing protein n=1 Tax=Cyphellophora attinorum TaxID=1664694 RepID=A0A0N1H2F2_9EURO|nr:uncharacterized protein AB675_10178 [Phialophora attinorum]KPI34275.1 hypothetical protein AB675_10178 [Phialophora attinorum]
MPPLSPAVQAVHAPGLIDFRKPAEYPIVLGESLKNGSSSASHYIDLQFNWQPKAGFGDADSRLRRADDGYRLNIDNAIAPDVAYRYTGHDRQLSSDGKEVDSFALVFDKERSVFVLETIAHSIDLNLEAAPSQSKEDVQRLPQLTKTSSTSKAPSNKPRDNDDPDPDNPFDFRNFMDEAKENTEKAAGFKSPLPGSRTPMSGFASPAMGATRFTPTIAQSLPREPKVVQSKPKVEPIKRKAKPMTSSATLMSSADSRTSKIHARNISTNIGSTPDIVVNDDDDDILKMDQDSPPQQATKRKRRIDPEIFRSHTSTPVLGQSPRVAQQQQRPRDRDVEMRDVREDDDVDELELGSPRAHRSATSRQSKHTKKAADRDHDIAPTPPNQNVSEDDEVAELEDLLGGDDDADTSVGLGLGITTGGSAPAGGDDDSEVSEEE